jgi:hypothetical protein
MQAMEIRLERPVQVMLQNVWVRRDASLHDAGEHYGIGNLYLLFAPR